MYTVVRFFHNTQAEHLAQFASLLDADAPGLYEGMGPQPNCFSCSISNQGTWHQHRNAILEFLQQRAELLASAITLGVGAQFDVAVYQEDYSVRYLTSLYVDGELAGALSQFDFGIVFTIYAGGDSESDTA